MRKLIAVCCALLLAVGVGAAWYLQAPSEIQLRKVASERPEVSRPSIEEWESPSLLAEMVKARREAGEDTLFLLGSSELTMPAKDTMHPNVFYDSFDNGFGVMAIGLHGCHCLWQAIETAALDERGALSPKRKVVLFVGMQWFFEEGCTTEAFLNRFSEEAFQECMANPQLSEETKERIRHRSQALGVDSQLLDDLASSSFVAKVNIGARKLFNGLEGRRAVADALEKQSTIADAAKARKPLLPWGKFDEMALRDAETACTNNDLGIYDDYYTTYWPEIQENMEKDDLPSFRDWNEDELADLQLFMTVCDELSIEPYMIIMPSMGQYYDETHYDKEAREALYETLRGMFEENGVPYLDMTNHDYDKYYLRDVMHLAWKGWVEVDQALYNFYWAPTGKTKSGHADFDMTGSAQSTNEAGEISKTEDGGKTTAEQDADTAAEEMLEVEGAGKEIMEDQEGDR